jgi:MATE family multidrug resistance protein
MTGSAPPEFRGAPTGGRARGEGVTYLIEADAAEPPRGAAAPAWVAEARATMRLAWPLIVAQLATIALSTTDVLFLGVLGPEALASGSLAVSFLFPFLMFGTGVVMAASPLIAQAVGGRRPRDVRRTARQGLWMALALSLPLVPAVAAGGLWLRLLGQEAPIAAGAGDYLKWAAWMFPSALMFVVLRGVVAALGETGVVLWIALAGVLCNAGLDWLLMFGRFGAPRLELAGVGIATAATHALMFGLLLAHVGRRSPYRRYRVLGRFLRPDWARFRAIWSLGAPIGLTLAAESGLFAAAALLMGWIGADALAAHAVALQLAALAFMVPLGLSHATTVRVGLAHGGGADAGRAGWTSIGLALGFMSVTATLFWLAPGALIGLFLDPTEPEAARPAALAASFLAIAALFQLADGAQVTAAAALRGLSDTRAPMAIALFGYWGVGLPTAWLLAFPMGLGGVGVWLGLAAGLGFAAATLAFRFARRDRVLLRRKQAQKRFPLSPALH